MIAPDRGEGKERQPEGPWKAYDHANTEQRSVDGVFEEGLRFMGYRLWSNE